MMQLMSSDKENMPDALACLAASACLAVSNIPFNGPVSEVRVALKSSLIAPNNSALLCLSAKPCLATS
jgi:polyribonucleotide nucleotidyltransferase